MPYRGPSIDHTILSPSGRASKRARKAALEREAARLFPPGYFDPPELTEAEHNARRAEALLRSAATLRDLAERGMKPRAHRKHAARLEAEAERLLTARTEEPPSLP